jgi:hypothetical protein
VKSGTGELAPKDMRAEELGSCRCAQRKFLQAKERANKPALAAAVGRETKDRPGNNNLFGDHERG